VLLALPAACVPLLGPAGSKTQASRWALLLESLVQPRPNKRPEAVDSTRFCRIAEPAVVFDCALIAVTFLELLQPNQELLDHLLVFRFAPYLVPLVRIIDNIPKARRFDGARVRAEPLVNV
jgi:hypothetical protein